MTIRMTPYGGHLYDTAVKDQPGETGHGIMPKKGRRPEKRRARARSRREIEAEAWDSWIDDGTVSREYLDDVLGTGDVLMKWPPDA